MSFRFTISRKIGVGFAILILTTLVLVFLTSRTLSTGREMNDNINDIYNPSVSSLEKLKSDVLRSKTLISMWAGVQSREDTKQKISLRKMLRDEIPGVKQNVDSLSFHWNETERRQKEKVYSELDALFLEYDKVQRTLVDMESYDMPYARFAMGELVEEGGSIDQKSQKVIEELNLLISNQRVNITKDSVTMINSFSRLETYLTTLGFGLFIAGLIIAYFTVKSIVVPVRSLRETLLILGKGKFPEKATVDTGDEIGEMSLALEQLVKGLKRTTEFSNNVGEGNYETEFEPLSEEDTLGHALLLMRKELKKRDDDYQRQVKERTREISEQKDKIEEQNEQRKELLENITASIKYARRLQENILPSESRIASLLPKSTIFFKPKDIVSGDFYFVNEYNGKVVFAAIDCTGHGVPGAFMSLVGHNALNSAIRLNPGLNPADILRDLNRLSSKALNSDQNAEFGMRDGMDLALCVLDRENATLEYAGAHNPLYLIRDQKIEVFKADKIGIGSTESMDEEFTRYKISLQKDDMIYIFSDGYVDQFGGEQGRKFMYEPFRQLLLSISTKHSDTQFKILDETLTEWLNAGEVPHEQIDDIIVMGVRF
ncbi:MAG: serine phosphatase RsbU (regulator of sigma subunit) [Flammeovirgaceae bacterium]|jgi:serine phosphatase RsbU (regulator of sigma subunit)